VDGKKVQHSTGYGDQKRRKKDRQRMCYARKRKKKGDEILHMALSTVGGAKKACQSRQIRGYKTFTRGKVGSGNGGGKRKGQELNRSWRKKM